MKVIQTIQSGTQTPVEVTWYTGDDKVEALAALVQAAAGSDNEYYRILDASITF